MLALVGLLHFSTAAGTRQTAWESLNVAPGCEVSLPKGLTEVPRGKSAESKDVQAVYRAFTDGATVYTFTTVKSGLKADTEMPPDRALSNFLAGTRDSLAKARIKYQRDVLFHGWPGLENILVGPDGVAVSMRSYVVNGAIYSLGVGYLAAAGRPDSVDRFLLSLALTPAVTGPLAAPGPPFETFQPKDAGFVVSMPSKPSAEDVAVPSGTSRRFLATYGNRIYVASYVAMPRSEPEPSQGEKNGALATLVDQAVKGMRGTAVGQVVTVKRDGLDFVRLDCTRSDGVAGRVEATFAQRRIFVIAMAYPSGHAGAPDIDAFFNSLKLVKN